MIFGLIISALGEDYHSIIYKSLYFILIGSTIQFLLMYKSPSIYKRFIDKLFNMKFTVFKTELTIYFAIIIWVLALIVFAVILKLQLYDVTAKKLDTITSMIGINHSFYKDKWVLEAELWMVMILIIEWW
jgi:hypothetical protein